MSFDSTSFAHAPEGHGLSAVFERWLVDEEAWDLKGVVERFEGAGKRKDANGQPGQVGYVGREQGGGCIDW